MIDHEAYLLMAAIAMDRFWGEFPNRWHPVAWLGKLLELLYQPLEKKTKEEQRVYGWVLAFLIPLFVALISWFFLYVFSGMWVYFIFYTLLLKSTFALRALGEAHFQVLRSLLNSDMTQARSSLNQLCSRSSEGLDQQELMSASISSIAENLTDSVVAPCFFYLVAGLPGAIFYRVVNTADAMFGYKDHRIWMGQGAAKIDDLMNFIPARITSLLLVVVAFFLRLPARRGFLTALRDRKKTPSPNGGWPMATMAGLMGIRLVKGGVYELGDRLSLIDAGHMRSSWTLVQAAGYIALILPLLFRGAL